MKTPKYITNHPNYNADDYAYLRGKGWTSKEIHTRWNKESGPTNWNGYWNQQKLASVA